MGNQKKTIIALCIAFCLSVDFQDQAAKKYHTDVGQYEEIDFQSINPFATGKEQQAETVRKLVYKYSPDSRFILEKEINELKNELKDEKYKHIF